MATQPTQNQVPSESPRDLKFNAGKIDEFVTSKQREYQDRFGVNHYTIEGLRWVAQQAISKFGYITIDSFQAGATLTLPNQILRDTTTGEYYRWDGEFPPGGKVVPSGATPASSGGIGVGAWLSVGDASLRSDLQLPDGASLIGFSGDGDAETVEEALLARPTLSDLTSGNGSSIGYQYSDDSTLRGARGRLAESLSILDFVKASDAGDYSLAMNRIFAKYADADSFQISFPQGTFSLKTQALYNGTALVSIIGQQGTKLSLDSTGTPANISITSVRRTVIADLEIDVKEPTSAVTKTGVYINCTGQDASHNLINVRGTASISKASTGIIFFDLVNVSLSNFSSCYVRYFGDYAKSEYSNNIAFRVGATTKISTDSRFDNCSVVGCEYPYLITPPNGASGYLEGVAWNNCTVVDCLYGPAIRGDSSKPYKSPMYRWIGGHIFAYKTCLDFYWVSQIIVDSAILYLVYDSGLSGSQGRTAITLNETVTTMIGDVIIRLVDQPNDGSSQGVYVGTNCSYTKISSLAVYTASQGKGVVSVPASKYTKAFDVTVLYSGTAPANAVSLGGGNDVNLGGNVVFPA